MQKPRDSMGKTPIRALFLLLLALLLAAGCSTLNAVSTLLGNEVTF